VQSCPSASPIRQVWLELVLAQQLQALSGETGRSGGQVEASEACGKRMSER